MENITNEQKLESEKQQFEIPIDTTFETTLWKINDGPEFKDIREQDLSMAKNIIENWWDTREIKALTVELARQLIDKYEWDTLDLSWLKDVDNGVLGALVNFKWKKLNLSWISSLDDQKAFLLSTFHGEDLDLSWITNLNESEAWILASFKWKVIHLNGLTDIEKVTAEKFANFWWDTLILWMENETPENIKKFNRFGWELLFCDKWGNIISKMVPWTRGEAVFGENK